MSEQLVKPLKLKAGNFAIKDRYGRTRIFSFKNAREGDKYDTATFAANASGAIVEGSIVDFFSNVPAGKRKNETNFSTPRKLDAGEEMLITKFGLEILPAYNDMVPPVNEVKKFISKCWMEWKINGILVDEGPAVKFASGYGLYGSTTENNSSIFSLGIPSQAAAPKLREVYYIDDSYSLQATLHYDPFVSGTAPTYTANMVFAFRAYIHGIIKSASTL